MIEIVILEYVHFLVDIKDLYFFTIACNAYKEIEPIFQQCVEHGLSTLDHYSYKAFIDYFQLEKIAEKDVEFMYASFRSFWWENSYPYESFDHVKVDELMEKVISLVTVIQQPKT